MLNLSISKHTDEEAIKEMEELKEIKGITLYCEPRFFTYTDNSTYTKSAIVIASEEEFCSTNGYHYSIDTNYIVISVPSDKQTQHLSGGTDTYINKALYDNKANECTLSILMLAPEEEDYADIEKKTIKFIADLLVENELNPDNLMRGFDLNKLGSPLHLLEKNKWRDFVKSVDEIYKAIKDFDEEDCTVDQYVDQLLEDYNPTYSDKDFRAFYLKNADKSLEYAEKFEPDSREIEAIEESDATVTSEINSFVTKNKTNFAYTITHNPAKSSDHCVKAVDTLVSKATPNNLEVEPIYPDLVVPPGGSITLTNKLTASNVQPFSNVLSLEELEKREKTFNIKDYADAKKVVEGKPVNNNDPYPIDDKIKELESHQPKLKIDEVNSKLHDCNHPGSVIGPAVAKNFAMVQDELITLAKRTERRMVKVENVLATMIRNIFRIGSRMNINCVYYGGQDVYGKKILIYCL